MAVRPDSVGVAEVAAGVTLDDLCEMPSDRDVPWLDRADSDERYRLQYLTAEEAVRCRDWQRDGVVRLPGLIPDEVLNRYEFAWLADNDPVTGRCSPGWDEIAYMRSAEVRDLFLFPPLMHVLNLLLGSPMALHLNLLDWRSTTRDWHQDDYLNPPFVNGHYAAVWIAVDDIGADSGPFQFVPGSHSGPVLRRGKVLAALGEDGSDRDWPWRSERLLSPLFEGRLAEGGVVPVTYLPGRGDVLVWHARLWHRGSRAASPDAERRAAIGHYSAIPFRADMARHAVHGGDPVSRYFLLGL